MVRRRILVLAASFAVVGCGGTGATPSAPADPTPTTAPTAASDVELTVFAAASLTNVVTELSESYTEATGTTFTLSFDASSALRTQIELGAPVDVFLSADTTNAQTLVDGDLTDGDAVSFAGNLLTIVVPASDDTPITDPFELADPGVQVVAAGDEVPITKYAVQVIEQLGALDDAPDGFVDAVNANIVSREDNVRAVLTKVELGEGDAGIVYVTDAATSDRVETVEIPLEANVPATYAGVVVGESDALDESHAFLEWIATDAGAREIFSSYGFTEPMQ